MSAWQYEMVNELRRAGHGEAGNVMKRYASTTGRSTAQLYRIAKQFGFQSGRKERTDKGDLKVALTDSQIEHIAGLIHTTARDNKGGIMPVERALKIAEDNGIIEPGQVAASTMQRILRDREISKTHLKEDTPHIRMRSLHPNHVHAVDVSVCIQYYLKNGQMKVMSEAEFNKNKPDNFKKVKTRLLRYLVVDHFSGAFYLKYYDTTGETAANLFDFLCEAWMVKQDDRFPFRGVPFFMLMDAGSAAISKPMSNFFEALDIKLPKNLPHNPRRQGCVETMHNVIEQWFESGLKIQPATSVEQLNLWAIDFSIWFQAMRQHTRHKATRFARWLQITAEQLREVDDVGMLREVYAKPHETRRVDGSREISMCGKRYSLRELPVRRGSEVLVTIKPYYWPQIDVMFNDTVYQISPIEMLPKELGGFAANSAVIGEEYKAQPETATQKAVKRIEDMAYGEADRKKTRPFAGTQIYGMDADKVGNITPIKRNGTPIELGREIVSKEIGIAEFLNNLRNEIGSISPALNKELKAAFGTSISRENAEAVIQAIAIGEDWRPVSATRQAL